MVYGAEESDEADAFLFLTATSSALRWFSLEEERVMQQSSVSISLSF